MDLQAYSIGTVCFRKTIQSLKVEQSDTVLDSSGREVKT